MTVNLALSDGQTAVVDYSDYELAAFVGDECRGVADFITAGNLTYGYLRVRSNEPSGEQVSFKVFKKSWNKELPVESQAIAFEAQSTKGQPSSPWGITFRSQYLITLESDVSKGTVSGAGYWNYDTEAKIKAEPATGYHFVRWSDGVTDNPYVFIVNKDLQLTAEFAPNQYTMTFVQENGAENIVLTQDYATSLTAPSAPVRTGFTFKGWQPEVPATIPASDQTFTAQWERNSYTLTFMSDGATVQSTSVPYESPVTAPSDPSKVGYTFTGWSPAVAETMPAEDVTYTAQFTINQYTMTFVQENGAENIVQTQDYATSLTAPTAPVRTGFTFKGWQPEVPATIPAEDQTFTAQWERNSYTLTFMSDGATVQSSHVLYESPVTAPSDPSKVGYTFTGWSPAVAETMPAEDVTYTAQFTINQYTMTFMIGDEVFKIVTLDFGTVIEVPEVPEKEGHTFTGWGDVPETVPATDLTFTGEYSKNKYIIRYYVGNEIVAEDEVLYGAEVLLRESLPEGVDGKLESWEGEIYETMPAHDIEYHAVIADGIQSVASSEQFGVWTLGGQKVNVTNTRHSFRPGIYIVNGKKVLMR